MNVMHDTGPDTLRPLGRSVQRRLELLDAADRVVMRDGPDASMNAIAAEAGVTKPILYRHFGDKDGLYRALANRHIEDLLDRLRVALTTRGGRRKRVELAIDAYLSVIESHPQVYRFLMHRASVEHPDVFGQVALVQRRIGDELAEGIAFDLGLSEAEKPVAQAWAHGIVGMVQQAGNWWLEERPMSREELVQQLADLLWGKFAFAPRVGGVL
jgi:AcrR family transcriptional regulator